MVFDLFESLKNVDILLIYLDVFKSNYRFSALKFVLEEITLFAMQKARLAF